MNRTIIYISLIFLPLIYIGCGGSKETKQKKELKKLALEVMEVHDRSMPNHGKLFGLKKKLLAIHDSIAHTEDSLHGKPSSIRTDIEDIIPKIEKADKDMMDWMHNYTAPDDFLPFEEKKAYYIEQKKIIEDVETLMNQAIERSNLLIQNFEKNK